MLHLAPFAAAALAGCHDFRSARDGKKTEIVYWTGWSGPELTLQESLAADFNRQNRDVRVRVLSQSGGYQKVRIAFAGGATPDLMSTVWAEEFASYALRGVLTPLDDYLLRSGRSLKEFTPGVARMLTIDGKTYGLAVTTNTTLIAYNKAIFREVGLDPEKPPRTIAELDDAAWRCTTRDKSGGYARYGFRPSGLSLWAYVFGGQWVDPTSSAITANHAGNLAALQWLQTYSKRYDLHKMEAFATTFGSAKSSSGPFFVGKIALWQTGEWAQQYVRRYAPKLDWGWFSLPTPPGGRSDVTAVGGSVFVIPDACPNKDAAWEFLNWITSPAPVKRFCLDAHNLPPLISVGRDPVFQDEPLYKFGVRISQGQNAFGPPPIPIWTTYSREIDRVEEKVMLGGADPKESLDTLQKAIEKEMRDAREELQR